MSEKIHDQKTEEKIKIISGVSNLDNEFNSSPSFNDQTKEEMTEYLIYNKLLYSKESLLFKMKFSYKII